MVGIGTARVKCPKCGAPLDVPFYQMAIACSME